MLSILSFHFEDINVVPAHIHKQNLITRCKTASSGLVCIDASSFGVDATHARDSYTSLR